MIVTIIRHGQAGSAVTDESRELTATGISDIGAAGFHLGETCKRKGLPMPSRIFHSAWRRTTQTAQILATQLSIPVLPFSPLLPQNGIIDVDTGLAKYADPADQDLHCLLVGHQPLVTQLVDHYLGQSGVAPPLPPGGLVCMDLSLAVADGGSLLFWAMPPEYVESV